MSKTKNIKFAFATAICFILVFSLMVSTFASAATSPNYEATQTDSYAPPMVYATTAPIMDTWENMYGTPAPDPAELDAKLKEAITAVKLIFDLDDDLYTRFYSSFNAGDGVYNPESWYLQWYSEDYNSQIYATVTSGGILLSYDKYGWSAEKENSTLKLAKVSKTQAQNTADNFLKKLLGNEAGLFRLCSQTLNYPSDRYHLDYILNKDGYDHTNYGISVQIDKMTGEIVNFYRYGHQFYFDLSKDIFAYQDASKVIPKEDALAAYLENIGVDLVYTSYFDYWNTRELKVQPVYRLKNNYNEYISAVDGSLVKLDPVQYVSGGRDKFEDGMGPAEEMAEMDNNKGQVSFSPAEIAAMDNMSKYITSDEAIAAMIKAFDIDINLYEFSVSTPYLSVDYINQNQYIWRIDLSKYYDSGYEYYSASVDARNGDIISYYEYSYDYGYKGDVYEYVDIDGDGKITDADIYAGKNPEYLYTYEEAKAIVMKKIKELLPKGIDLDKDFELVANDYYNIQPLSDTAFKDSNYYFNLVRKVNGINFEDNYIGVNFNNMTGKIMNYNISWYEDAKFPAINNIISPAEALNSIADYADYAVYYMSNGMTDDGKINVSLLYVFGNYVNVDPYTGKWVGYNFEEIQKYTAAKPDYKDLAGHWSENIVNTLTDNGIYVWGGEAFDPTKGITKGELLEYLSFYTNRSYTFTQMKESIFVDSRANFYSDADLDKVITRQEALKIICEIAGYGEIGSHYEIFIYPFNDVECDKEYKGYISIMKTFGIINGDEKGGFNAFKTLTRAEAAAIVYNIVMSYGK